MSRNCFAFRFKMASDENSEEGNVSVIVDRKSTPSHVADMMVNFVELGTTLTVCRNRMEVAQERMEKYLAKQMKIYKVPFSMILLCFSTYFSILF